MVGAFFVEKVGFANIGYNMGVLRKVVKTMALYELTL